jgi:hypothetical protein
MPAGQASVHKEKAGATDHQGQYDGNAEYVIFKSFALFVVVPVHEKTVLHMHHARGHCRLSNFEIQSAVIPDFLRTLF